MASNAKIGALHVSLGLNSAQFETGLKKAGTGLSHFGKKAGLALAGVAAAAAAAAAALGVAVKGAIDHADTLSKTAQKIGVTTEALSRLEWAAKLSDVSLEGLANGLKKLSQNLFEVGSGAGATAKRGFDALGISVTKSDGSLRAADDVLADVADKFSRMEDGTAKTAIAVALFGRAGAELIPLLNEGRDGLKDMADEADRLGLTISTKTGKAAEAFNDSLTRLNAVFAGIVNRVMESLIPSLQEIAVTISSPEFAKAAQDFANTMVGALNVIAQAAVVVIETIRGIGQAIDWANTHDMLGNKLPDPKPGSQAFTRGKFGPGGAMDQLRRQLGSGATGGPGDDFFRGIFGGSGGAASPPAVDPFVPAIGGAKALKDEIETTTPKVAEMQQAFMDLGTTVESSLSGIMSGLVSDVIKGQDAFGGLISKVGQLGDKLIEMAFNQAIQGLFGSLFGAGFGTLGNGIGPGATWGGVQAFAKGVPAFAGGTSFAPGGMAWVGERGPELVNLPRGAQVIPHDLSMRAANGGGGITIGSITVNANSEKEGAAAARGFSAELNRHFPAAMERYQRNPLRRAG